jgi:hypothetical protein
MTHPLDADTALEPLTPTRWRGQVTERWWVVRGPFGGYLAALLVRALVAAVAEPARRPRSLTVVWAAVGTLLAQSRQPALIRG